MRSVKPWACQRKNGLYQSPNGSHARRTHHRCARLFDEADEALPVRAMPVRVRKAIKSVRVVKRVLTREGGDEIVETATHVEFWDKNSALITMAKHLGLFERDNSQQKEPIRVTVELVG